MHRARAIAWCLLLGLVTAACQDVHPSLPAASETMPLPGAYVLQPGDRIEIRPVQDAAYATVARIAPDGRITVPGISAQVAAAGRTIPELTEQIRQRYRGAGVLRDPLFTVTLVDVANNEAFVAGEVLHPGVVPLNAGPRSLLQAVVARGGPLSTASLHDVAIIRVGPDGEFRIFSADLAQVLNGDDLTRNAKLTAMDIVVVPKTAIAQWDVWVDQYVRQAVPVPLSLLLRLTNSPTLVP